ncbi:MAG: phenazine biosynthesis family protein [Devosia sp.]|nr:phenazine biosynthesis family protein [Devosia sp.]
MNTTTSPDTMANFAGLLRTALGDSLARDATTFLSMMAEDGVVEFPYLTAGAAPRLEGRAALSAHLASLEGMIEIDGFHDLVVHKSLEPGVFILEFTCIGRGAKTRLPYNQRYISVITVKDGHIVRYLDYWNPLILQQAMGEAAHATREGQQS